MKLSIIIINHKSYEDVKSFIELLAEQVSPKLLAEYEFIIIDNTGDDIPEFWETPENIRNLSIHRNERIQGFAANANLGMRLAKSQQYCAIINPDIRPCPGLFETLVDFMDRHRNVGIAGPQLLNDSDGSIQPSCRRFSTVTAHFFRGLQLDSIFPGILPVQKYLMSDFDHNTILDVDWITGAMMLIRFDAVYQVGYMDERFFLYAEDQDFCCRMWHHNWKVYYIPQAKAYHEHQRAGVRRPFSRYGYYHLTSLLRLFIKHNWSISRSR